ncbi:hypothetical protein NFI96_011172 [Prochilodus magdalenae]|nr:hypothetical protein NFI96_011172 [Prochilodus magdalenae]
MENSSFSLSLGSLGLETGAPLFHSAVEAPSGCPGLACPRLGLRTEGALPFAVTQCLAEPTDEIGNLECPLNHSNKDIKRKTLLPEELLAETDANSVTMKLMDEVAGIVAARHCKTNIVTASVDAINFHRKIMKGMTFHKLKLDSVSSLSKPDRWIIWGIKTGARMFESQFVCAAEDSWAYHSGVSILGDVSPFTISTILISTVSKASLSIHYKSCAIMKRLYYRATFHRAGCVITVSGRMTFTSNKSMEIEVFVDADPLVEAEKGKYRAVTAFFTYISLDKDNKPLPVPPLKSRGDKEMNLRTITSNVMKISSSVVTGRCPQDTAHRTLPTGRCPQDTVGWIVWLEGEEEQKRFEEGKARYLQNKAKRLADKEQKQ